MVSESTDIWALKIDAEDWMFLGASELNGTIEGALRIPLSLGKLIGILFFGWWL